MITMIDVIVADTPNQTDQHWIRASNSLAYDGSKRREALVIEYPDNSIVCFGQEFPFSSRENATWSGELPDLTRK
jgi:hypothetical protein